MRKWIILFLTCLLMFYYWHYDDGVNARARDIFWLDHLYHICFISFASYTGFVFASLERNKKIKLLFIHFGIQRALAVIYRVVCIIFDWQLVWSTPNFIAIMILALIGGVGYMKIGLKNG